MIGLNLKLHQYKSRQFLEVEYQAATIDKSHHQNILILIYYFQQLQP
jgi:hypothetical protein